MSNYRYFSDAEVAGLDKELCAQLDIARDKSGVPFVITCGLRTPQENAALKGAVADSAHLTGHAVDLEVGGDDHALNRMIFGLITAGLDFRMGLYYVVQGTKLVPRHIHVDNLIDVQHPAQVTWALREENQC